MEREPLLDIWLPFAPRGKGRAKFRSVPRSDAPYIEREIDPETGATVARDPKSPDIPVGKMVKHYALKNIRPMAYGESTTQHEAEIRDVIIQLVGRTTEFNTLKGAVRVDWCAFFPYLLSDSRKVREDKVRGLVSHTKTPDKDNIEKIILDAMSEIVFFDDCQVNFGTGAKIYSPHEGIRARIYQSDPAEVKQWADENFPFPEKPFVLEG